MLIFVGSFPIFLALGLYKDYLDEAYWEGGAALLAAGKSIAPDNLVFGYPGSTLIFPNAALILLGFSAEISFKLVVAFYLAILTASAALLGLILRPQSVWWIALVIIFLTNPLYYSGTPPSIVLPALITLIALFLLYIFERKITSVYAYIGLGVLCGIALATRFDFSMLFLLCVTVFLLFTRKLKGAFLLCVAAVSTCFLATPFIWIHALSYLLAVYLKIAEHLSNPIGFAYDTGPLIPPIVCMILSIYLGGRSFLRNEDAIPRPILVWLYFVTIVLGGVLYSLSFHPIWYFFPMIFLWQALLPLFAFHLLERVPLPQSGILGTTRKRLELDCIAAFAVLQLVFLFNVLP